MASVLIVGDGPGGLTAAMFLAKRGMDVEVLGTDGTANHKALLPNYPGIQRITGTEFQQVLRKQAEGYGARIHRAQVARLEAADGVFRLTTDQGARHEGRYLIIAAGPRTDLGGELGVEKDERSFIRTDRNGRTNVDRVYAVGWSTRADKVQAVISAGDGAAAALDILSLEKGKDLHDFDTP